MTAMLNGEKGSLEIFLLGNVLVYYFEVGVMAIKWITMVGCELTMSRPAQRAFCCECQAIVFCLPFSASSPTNVEERYD